MGKIKLQLSAVLYKYRLVEYFALKICLRINGISLSQFRKRVPLKPVQGDLGNVVHFSTAHKQTQLRYMATLSGEATQSFIYLLPFSRDLLSKGRICSSWSKFFPFRVNLSLEGLC